MIELDSYAPRTAPSPRTLANTIYRDTPLTARTGRPAARFFRGSLYAPALPEERASNGLLLGLAALTLPAVAYSFMQLWSLMAGGALGQAVRAFLP